MNRKVLELDTIALLRGVGFVWVVVSLLQS